MKHYYKRYYCMNCNQEFFKYYEFGKPAESNPECGNCGVSDEDMKRQEILSMMKPK